MTFILKKKEEDESIKERREGRRKEDRLKLECEMFRHDKELKMGTCNIHLPIYFDLLLRNTPWCTSLKLYSAIHVHSSPEQTAINVSMYTFSAVF